MPHRRPHSQHLPLASPVTSPVTPPVTPPVRSSPPGLRIPAARAFVKAGAKRSTELDSTRSWIGSASSRSSWARLAAAGLLTKHAASVSSTLASASGTAGLGTVSTTPSTRPASASSRLPATLTPGCSSVNRRSRSGSGSHTTSSAWRVRVRASV